MRNAIVLVNLVTNAIKFTPEGGRIVVTVSLAENGESFLRFDVKDTGVGIQRSDRERLFLPWVQLDPLESRQKRGTGLGLAICRELCQLMGGRIWLRESEVNKGSTFAFEFPLKLPDTSAESRSSKMEKVSEEAVKGKEILILSEDHRSRRTMVRSTLGWEMRPTQCSSKEEAMDYLEAGYTFDVAIIQMSGGNHNDMMQLARLILERHPDVPLLGLSTTSFDELERVSKDY